MTRDAAASSWGKDNQDKAGVKKDEQIGDVTPPVLGVGDGNDRGREASTGTGRGRGSSASRSPRRREREEAEALQRHRKEYEDATAAGQEPAAEQKLATYEMTKQARAAVRT